MTPPLAGAVEGAPLRCPACNHASGLKHEHRAATAGKLARLVYGPEIPAPSTTTAPLVPIETPTGHRAELTTAVPGEVTLCFVCGALLQYDQHLQLHPLPDRAARQFAAMVPGLAALVAEIRSRRTR